MLRIKEILKSRGITVTQFSKDLGLIRQNVVAQLETEKISIATLKRYADYLQVPISSLFDDYPSQITCSRCGRIIPCSEYEKKD